ncbi:MAG: MotA/TolQ/ExbB proton channel family protein [Bacteroidales bacterium]
MTKFFFEGGIIFMGILSLLFLGILSLSALAIVAAVRNSEESREKGQKLLGHLKSLALFALVFAVFSQILGLVDVFSYLADKGPDVAYPGLAKGIKLTFHSTIYGMIIYLFSILMAMGLRFLLERGQTDAG